MYNIEELIPQRSPILLVDKLVSADTMHATTAYTVKEEAALVQNGMLTEVGIIEHMAQSASALAGFNSRENGGTEPLLGMIGEVKNFHLYASPLRGQQIRTEIEMGLTVGEVTNVKAKTYVDEQLMASCTFKIVIK